MTLPEFEYCRARSVEEALQLYAEKPQTRYLAGGTDLLPQMRTGRRRLTRVVDIKGVTELGRIAIEADGAVAIGATVPMAAIADHPAVRERYPLLRDCCLAVGAYPLRHRASMGGNICNASPAADTAVALLALEARIRTRGPAGGREIPVHQFFAGPGSTALRDGELVADIVLPSRTAGMRGGYERLSRRRGMDLATLGVLVGRLGDHAKDGTSYRVALAAVAPTPVRVPEAEALLDADSSEGALIKAVEIARSAAKPISDVRGSADYRREMVGVLLRRLLVSLRAPTGRH